VELSRYIFNGLRLKIVTKGNGKDVLWSLSALRFYHFEIFRCYRMSRSICCWM